MSATAPFQGAGRKTDLIARQQTQIGGAGSNVVALLHDCLLRTALDALNFSFRISIYGFLHGRCGMKSGFHGLHFQFFNKNFGAWVFFVVHHAGAVHAGDDGVIVVCKDFGGDKGVMGSLHQVREVYFSAGRHIEHRGDSVAALQRGFWLWGKIPHSSLFVLFVLSAWGDERLAGAVIGKYLLGVLLGDRGQGDNIFLDHVIHRRTISL